MGVSFSDVDNHSLGYGATKSDDRAGYPAGWTSLGPTTASQAHRNRGTRADRGEVTADDRHGMVNGLSNGAYTFRVRAMADSVEGRRSSRHRQRRHWRR